MNYHWIFPIMALTIYCCTPKGCNKTINWILSGLFVLIWSFEEYIERSNAIDISSGFMPNFTDGLWYDWLIAGLFLVAAFLFYRSGGKVQFKLALFGVVLCLFYAYLGSTGLYYEENFRRDFYYVETMIGLYLAQLFVSTGGMMFALSNKWMGEHYGANIINSRDHSRNSHVDNGDPRC